MPDASDHDTMTLKETILLEGCLSVLFDAELMDSIREGLLAVETDAGETFLDEERTASIEEMFEHVRADLQLQGLSAPGSEIVATVLARLISEHEIDEVNLSMAMLVGVDWMGGEQTDEAGLPDEGPFPSLESTGATVVIEPMSEMDTDYVRAALADSAARGEARVVDPSIADLQALARSGNGLYVVYLDRPVTETMMHDLMRAHEVGLRVEARAIRTGGAKLAELGVPTLARPLGEGNEQMDDPDPDEWLELRSPWGVVPARLPSGLDIGSVEAGLQGLIWNRALVLAEADQAE